MQRLAERARPGWKKILLRIEEGQGLGRDIELMEFIADNIAGKSFCPFGEASVWGLQSNLLKYRSEFTSQIESTNPEEGRPGFADSP